jgi:hypothetical protein
VDRQVRVGVPNRYRQVSGKSEPRIVLFLPGLASKTPALAWPEMALALAFSNPRASQSRQPGLDPGLALPRPRLLHVKTFNLLEVQDVRQ